MKLRGRSMARVAVQSTTLQLRGQRRPRPAGRKRPGGGDVA